MCNNCLWVYISACMRMRVCLSWLSNGFPLHLLDSFRSQHTKAHTPTCPADWKAARISGSSLKGREREEVAIATLGGCRFYWRKKIGSAYPLISLASLNSFCLTFRFLSVLISSPMSWRQCREMWKLKSHLLRNNFPVIFLGRVECEGAISLYPLLWCCCSSNFCKLSNIDTCIREWRGVIKVNNHGRF